MEFILAIDKVKTVKSGNPKLGGVTVKYLGNAGIYKTLDGVVIKNVIVSFPSEYDENLIKTLNDKIIKVEGRIVENLRPMRIKVSEIKEVDVHDEEIAGVLKELQSDIDDKFFGTLKYNEGRYIGSFYYHENEVNIYVLKEKMDLAHKFFENIDEILEKIKE